VGDTKFSGSDLNLAHSVLLEWYVFL